MYIVLYSSSRRDVRTTLFYLYNNIITHNKIHVISRFVGRRWVVGRAITGVVVTVARGAEWCAVR